MASLSFVDRCQWFRITDMARGVRSQQVNAPNYRNPNVLFFTFCSGIFDGCLILPVSIAEIQARANKAIQADGFAAADL